MGRKRIQSFRQGHYPALHFLDSSPYLCDALSVDDSLRDFAVQLFIHFSDSSFRVFHRRSHHHLPSHNYGYSADFVGGTAALASFTASTVSLAAVSAFCSAAWAAIGSGAPCSCRNSPMRYSPRPRKLVAIMMYCCLAVIPATAPPPPEISAPAPPLRNDRMIPNIHVG